MPEVEFGLDPRTGQLEMQVKGIAGPACDDVATLVRQLLGQPAVERQTEEHRLKPAVRPQVRPRGRP